MGSPKGALKRVAHVLIRVVDTSPEWVLKIWKRKMPVWPWKNGTNIASAVNVWLIRWGSPPHVLASSPREALDRRLIELVLSGVLHKLKYESLIDHTRKRHISNFAQGERIDGHSDASDSE